MPSDLSPFAGEHGGSVIEAGVRPPGAECGRTSL